MKPPVPIEIRTVAAADVRGLVPALADLLIDAVASGASVSFMAPLERERAIHFWEGVADEVVAGRRHVLVARTPDGAVVGTVQLILVPMPNQPHRAEIAKLIVLAAHRGRGIATALMQLAEAVAAEDGRTLLTLDTVTGSIAARLYERLGWQHTGVIPGFALHPDGRLADASIYWKSLSPDREA